MSNPGKLLINLSEPRRVDVAKADVLGARVGTDFIQIRVPFAIAADTDELEVGV
jgi:hypothetical protein